MEKRVNIQERQPQAYKAMLALEGYLATTSLSKTVKELIKIRASQINGCAFCLDMHTKDALQYGERAQRIFVLSAWHEVTNLFSEEEQVALTMTEEITRLDHDGLLEETYKRALGCYTEIQIAEIIMAVVTINGWNRIALSTHLQVEANKA